MLGKSSQKLHFVSTNTLCDPDADAEILVNAVGCQVIVMLKKLGPLALKILLSDTSSPKKSEVTRDVGKEAFDLGLLIGEEGYFYLGENNSSERV